MVRKIVWSLLLFLVVLTLVSRDFNFVVDAFATRSRTHFLISSTPGRTIVWSSSKASAVEKKASSTRVTIDKESSSEGITTSNASVGFVVNAIGDMNEDDIIKSMIKEPTTTEKGADESEGDNLVKQIKESGLAGVISYAAWELAFWTVSVPVCLLGYKEVTGHWPDLQNKEDLSKLGAEAFAFVNFARFAVPLRIGLALGTIPWIQENVVDVFLVDEDSNGNKDAEMTVKECEDDDDPDGTIIKQSAIDGEEDSDPEEIAIKTTTKDSEEEENAESKGSRFRTRLGNLISRILRRKN